ncbi:sortase A [Microbacterium sp. AG1240]|uniref:class E sortase n=1 Tax=Microbacterium sp. AG1240 TaxID=2183992 RepID=UPI000F127A74|nr:class E sortase [Microbacterium sp. AG1240]RKT31606.1 sortase A [Microbacterium sp. AG1240]
MQTLEDAPPATRRERRATPPPKRRRRVSVIGVIGELLMTAGVIIFLYVAWQMWIGDVITGAQANAASQELSQNWAQEYDPAPPIADPSVPEPEAVTAEPPVLPQPADAETFAVMYIPRFGADYSREVAGGTTRPRTLDTDRIGHYTDAAMPGQVGNFAVAAHRTTYGAPFNRLAELHVGDAIVIETQAGWYTYRFRTLQYVKPTEVDVLLDVPQAPDVPAGERYITLTSCSPMFSLAERIVGYGLFESFSPRTADGALPASLTEAVV